MSSVTGSGGKSESESKQRVQIPDFLRPFVEQSTGVAGRALSGLERSSRGDLTAPFAPAQEAAQGLGIQRALGEGGFFPGAQQTALGIAQGGELGGQGTLEQLAQGGNIDPQTLETLRGAAQGGALPGQDVLSQLSQGGAVPDQARQTLEQTAGGDFLFGGQGFDQAVQAAQRAAQPGILSAFGSAGRGGATGGLAQEAIGQSAIDAFARQFAQERQNQLGAAGQLGELGLAETGQQADIAGLLGSQGLQQGQQQIGAATQLGQFGLGGGDQQIRAALGLGDLGLAGQGQQLQAAGMLPGLATADVNLLSGIGGQQQDQEQQEIDAPRLAQLDLLSAALGGLPISSLLGRDQEGSQKAFQLGFTAE